MQQPPRLGIIKNGYSSTFKASWLLTHCPIAYVSLLCPIGNGSNPTNQYYFLSLNFDFNFPKKPLARFDFLSVGVELLATGLDFAAETALSGCCDI